MFYFLQCFRLFIIGKPGPNLINFDLLRDITGSGNTGTKSKHGRDNKTHGRMLTGSFHANIFWILYRPIPRMI